MVHWLDAPSPQVSYWCKTDTTLRYMGPSAFEAELRSAETGFRKLWTEMPWGENK